MSSMKAEEQFVSRTVQLLAVERRSYFVSCWHANTDESAAFWEKYDETKGIAIKSSVGRLKAAASDAPAFFLGEILYTTLESINLENMGNALSLPFLKRPSFAYEQEVRVMYWDIATLPRLDQAPEFHRLPVNLEALIDAVYLTPKSPPWLLDEIREVLIRFGLQKVSLYRSKLYDPR